MLGHRITLTAAMALFFSGSLHAGETEPAHDVEPAWGGAVNGIQIAVEIKDDFIQSGTCSVKLRLRNTGAVPVNLPAESFCWLFIAQSSESGKKGYFTSKVPLVKKEAGDAPTAAASGTVDLGEFSFGDTDIYPYAKNLKVTSGFPGAENQPLPPPAGKLNRTIQSGKVTGKVMVFLPGEKQTFLTSNAIDITVKPPDLAKLTDEERRKFVVDLLARFDKDAWSASSAHDTAVALGSGIVPDLVAAVKDIKRPGHSSMWLATAIADIRSEKSAEALIALLDDSRKEIRYVIAYHGQKQENEKLDKAIIGKASAGGDDRFTAWALVGFLVHRKTAPEALLKAGLESGDPRARAAAVQALATMAGDKSVAPLRILAKDADQRVSATAKKVLEAMNQNKGTQAPKGE
jgi:hypothetical protein